MKAVFCFKLIMDGEEAYSLVKSRDKDDKVCDVAESDYNELHEGMAELVKYQLGEDVKVIPVSAIEYLAMTEE